MFPAVELLSPYDAAATGRPVLLAFGQDTPSCNTFCTQIDRDKLHNLGSEGYLIRAVSNASHDIIIGIGNAHSALSASLGHGIVYAVYDILQRFGFLFLHPLSPETPPKLAAFESAFKPYNASTGWVVATSPRFGQSSTAFEIKIDF